MICYFCKTTHKYIHDAQVKEISCFGAFGHARKDSGARIHMDLLADRQPNEGVFLSFFLHHFCLFRLWFDFFTSTFCLTQFIRSNFKWFRTLKLRSESEVCVSACVWSCVSLWSVCLPIFHFSYSRCANMSVLKKRFLRLFSTSFSRHIYFSFSNRSMLKNIW